VLAGRGPPGGRVLGARAADVLPDRVLADRHSPPDRCLRHALEPQQQRLLLLLRQRRPVWALVGEYRPGLRAGHVRPVGGRREHGLDQVLAAYLLGHVGVRAVVQRLHHDHRLTVPGEGHYPVSGRHQPGDLAGDQLAGQLQVQDDHVGRRPGRGAESGQVTGRLHQPHPLAGIGPDPGRYPLGHDRVVFDDRDRHLLFHRASAPRMPPSCWCSMTTPAPAGGSWTTAPVSATKLTAIPAATVARVIRAWLRASVRIAMAASVITRRAGPGTGGSDPAVSISTATPRRSATSAPACSSCTSDPGTSSPSASSLRSRAAWTAHLMRTRSSPGSAVPAASSVTSGPALSCSVSQRACRAARMISAVAARSRAACSLRAAAAAWPAATSSAPTPAATATWAPVDPS